MIGNDGKDIAVATISGKIYVTPVSAKGHVFMQQETAKPNCQPNRYLASDTYMWNEYPPVGRLIELATARGLEIVVR